MLDSFPMQEGLFLMALFFTIAVARPLFWLLALTASRWVGERVLPHWLGRLLFGRYWKKRQRPAALQRRRH